MAGMLQVKLTRLWDGHAAGAVVTVEDYTAESMVRKGYGEILKAPATDPAPRARGPQTETAEAPPAAETAESPPQVVREHVGRRRRGRKAGN